MAGLLDLFGGDATQPGALYGGLLTPQQNSALGYRGLLAAAGALGQAAMPSRLPIPIGAALGQAAGAMGSAQDEAALNAMRGQLVGLQGQSLASDLAIRKQLMPVIQGIINGGGAGASPVTGASPTGGGEIGSPAPNAQTASAAPKGAFDTGDPDLNLIAKYESNFNPMAGWGGSKDVDLSGYPLTSTGFPDWKGNPGPQGNSTAAGLFQIEKSTWNSVAPGLIAAGVMKPDFSVESQIAVAKALKAKNGLSDWLPYNPQLAAAYKRGEQVQFPNKPTQLAQANTGTVTDAVPAVGEPSTSLLPAPGTVPGPTMPPGAAQFRGGLPPGVKFNSQGVPYNPAMVGANGVPPGIGIPAAPSAAASAPQGLLPPQAPGSDTLRVGGAGGLLAPPQPTATPFTNAPPINGVGAPAPGPQGGMLAPQAPQVAQAVPRAPMAPGAPGMGIGLPPVPNIDPRALAAASSLAQLGHMGDVFGPLEKYYYQSPGYLGQAEAAKAAGALPAHNAETQFKTNEDIRAAFAKPGELRTNGLAYIPGTGQILARNPAVPEGYTVGGTATNPIAEPIPNALQGISNVEAAKKGGGYQAEFGAVPGVNFTGNAANLTPQAAPQTKPVATPQGTQLPPLTDQFMPQSPGELEHAIPAWQKKTDEWNAGIAPARQAEMRLSTIAQAFKLTETGAFETHKAELATALKSLGIDPTPVMQTNPAAVQMALHDNILTTLPLLKAATPRPSQIEFMSVSENREHPNLQPAANLRMLTEDLALVRQAQQLPADWNAAQQQGWRNPQSFEAAWSRLNPLDSTRDQVEKEIGPLKGMPGNTTPKQTAPEGAIINGPNGQRLQNRGGQWLDLQTLKPYQP